MSYKPTRRDFFVGVAGATSAGLMSWNALAQPAIPQRRIPRTGEAMPVIGLGSSKAVEQIATNGSDPLRDVLRVLVAHGGKLVDTWPRNPDNDAAFGRVINLPDLRDKLFVTTKLDQVGKQAGIDQFRLAQRLYGRKTLDLVQIFSLTDLDTHWPTLQEWKDTGEARYIGVTVSQPQMHERLAAFLDRATPDFVQMNYSITERDVENRLLPMAADKGAAVVINRPFMNGAYFQRLEGRPLPGWAAEFDCTSWAQFSLKYILAHPSLTAVLTETSNPEHMEENLLAATGPLPSEALRQRMRELIAGI